MSDNETKLYYVVDGVRHEVNPEELRLASKEAMIAWYEYIYKEARLIVELLAKEMEETKE